MFLTLAGLSDDIEQLVEQQLQLYVVTNYDGPNLTITLECGDRDNHDALARIIHDRLGNPPGNFDIYFKLDGMLKDHRVVTGMFAYYLVLDRRQPWGDEETDYDYDEEGVHGEDPSDSSSSG